MGYIERAKIEQFIKENYIIRSYDIDLLPDADVTPVRHGRWITTSGEFFPGSNQFLCYSHKHEECGFQYVDMNENTYDYCPNCGATMDLED